MENKKKDILQKINQSYVDKITYINEKLSFIEENVLKNILQIKILPLL